MEVAIGKDHSFKALRRSMTEPTDKHQIYRNLFKKSRDSLAMCSEGFKSPWGIVSHNRNLQRAWIEPTSGNKILICTFSGAMLSK